MRNDRWGDKMKDKRKTLFSWVTRCLVLATLVVFSAEMVRAGDLDELKQRGVLRHLGVRYANFVTGSGDGLDVELMKLFADHLGVTYQYVETTWERAIGDLTGKLIEVKGEDIKIKGDTQIKGDIIANGLTLLAWREKILDFSIATFPTQVWLLTSADSPANPIQPSQDIAQDIAATKALLTDYKISEVIGIANTCVDPRLYQLEPTGTRIRLVDLNLNELAPAVINGVSEATLLDVPDALMALEKWTGRIKILGPISKPQVMACGFAKTSPELRGAFNAFFEECKQKGIYRNLVNKYYPLAFTYFPEFFNVQKAGAARGSSKSMN